MYINTKKVDANVKLLLNNIILVNALLYTQNTHGMHNITYIYDQINSFDIFVKQRNIFQMLILVKNKSLF